MATETALPHGAGSGSARRHPDYGRTSAPATTGSTAAMTAGRSLTSLPLRVLLIACALAAAAVLAACGSDEPAGGPADQQAAAAEGAEAGDSSGLSPAAGTLADVPGIYQDLQPSVVAVLVTGSQGGGEGSGVVYRPNRIVTNNHVVEGAREVVVVLATGERLPAEVLATDPRTDLAVLAIERELPPATFADALPPVGSLAVAIGNPLGFEDSVTAGVVSGIDRAVPSGGNTPALVNLVQTDAAISPGNSGGALVGADREVIGINVAYIPPQASAVSIGFAIPAPTVVDIVDELLADGQVDHPYLGVSLRPITPQIAEQLGLETRTGAAVALVEPGSPADAAGLEAGDVIVEAAGERVEQVEDVLSVLRGREAGDRLELTVVRGGERQTYPVTLGERPRRLAPR